jgi:hypothetical protein
LLDIFYGLQIVLSVLITLHGVHPWLRALDNGADEEHACLFGAKRLTTMRIEQTPFGRSSSAPFDLNNKENKYLNIYDSFRYHKHHENKKRI